MEPKKFEEHIKEQLQKREIKPAVDSWDKLAARLETGGESTRLNFWWVGIAAAIAGVFFFLGTLFNSGVEPAVVEQTSEEILPGKSIPPETEVLIASEKPENMKVLIPEPLPVKNQVLQAERAIAIQVKLVENDLSEIEEVEVDFSESEKAVAEVFPESSSVSDAEVDALLNTAMGELERSQSSYAVQPIDPEELLYEVEYELEQSFRQKVFEVLKEGFSRARTAVANKNY